MKINNHIYYWNICLIKNIKSYKIENNIQIFSISDTRSKPILFNIKSGLGDTNHNES